MQEIEYIDRSGALKRKSEFFYLRDDETIGEQLRKRYEAAIAEVFSDGGELLSIKQGRIGRNDPCPCRSGKKFKKCCAYKVAAKVQA